ncbi:large-conductance mechanosensitive channel protein MscL [Solimonas variicoloris]|uniref:large-conductance mechanosensitive channel protein MscL n=1 Tax=Solimonas variicoloris TaxID=254408 RepID=UPI00036F0DC9|nr:large-conductance mechanosensitive channel protein MscL [Solimonas variicoloris]
MGMIQEFKDFAMRGNVVDLAVGVVIGAAFGKIVSSLVADVITPVIGLIVGGVDFSDLAITLKAAQGDQAAVLLSYGKFIQTIFDFVIIAFAIFVVIKLINRLQRQKAAEPAPPAPPPAQEVLLTEIRDLLKQQRG